MCSAVSKTFVELLFLDKSEFEDELKRDFEANKTY